RSSRPRRSFSPLPTRRSSDLHPATTIVQATRQRRRHLVLLDLLAAPHPTRAGTRVLDDAAPVAYCLPRGVGSVTVLSRGLLDVRSEEHTSELQSRFDLVCRLL